jgi:hypothetical protein
MLVGVIIGCIITIIVSRCTSICTIVIDRSDPDSPYPFLEGKVPLTILERKKYVTARIRTENYISQK